MARGDGQPQFTPALGRQGVGPPHQALVATVAVYQVDEGQRAAPGQFATRQRPAIEAVLASGIPIDMLYGPAYKGIPLVSVTALALARSGQNLPFAFNRKEAKDHGEGGNIIGTPLAGRVLIIDDVISAGTSVRESVEIIRDAGATPCGVLIALDRMERGTGLLSATQEVEQDYRIPVVAVATLDDLLAFLKQRPDFAARL